MSVGLKNSMEIIKEVSSVIHFAVNEQCSEFTECNLYREFIATKPVFHIEYPNGDEEIPAKDLVPLCKDSPTGPRPSDPKFDISKFSTVIKGIPLGGFVQYCDNSTYNTPVQE
jgi:hypothetical protein